jgi:hypothetical protein
MSMLSVSFEKGGHIMSRIKTILSITITITFLLSGAASALTPKSGTLKPERGVSDGEQNKLRRITSFMDRIENNVLYLQNKKSYHLDGVNVVYQSAESKPPARGAKKKIVELIFLDNQLKEVVVHP